MIITITFISKNCKDYILLTWLEELRLERPETKKAPNKELFVVHSKKK